MWPAGGLLMMNSSPITFNNYNNTHNLLFKTPTTRRTAAPLLHFLIKSTNIVDDDDTYNKHLLQQQHSPVINASSSLMCTSSSSSNNNKLTVVKCSSNQVEDIISLNNNNDDDEEEACELVNGTELTIGAGDGPNAGIRAFLFTAVKNNNEAGILLLSDIFGFDNSSTTDFAYRLACNGYNVLVPDLFNGDSWTKERPMALLEEWISKHNPEQIAKTIFASAEWMRNEFAAAGISNIKLGIIGFCYGGGRVIDILAQDQHQEDDGYFGSGVSFYGTRIDSKVASNIKVPLLMITGENDALCPVDVLEDVTRRNKQVKKVVFPGRGHGFAHRPQTPEEDADAEEAFAMMRCWLHDGLLVKS